MSKSLQFPSQGVGTGFLYICLNQAAKRDDCGINSSYPPLGALQGPLSARRRIAPSKVEITKATPQEFFHRKLQDRLEVGFCVWTSQLLDINNAPRPLFSIWIGPSLEPVGVLGNHPRKSHTPIFRCKVSSNVLTMIRCKAANRETIEYIYLLS
jgi:hypothetical protein